ncbi:hypothetical protein NDU88_000804 [Pleurodeles waltl]|uniref:Uncharacterized protein n=1 Tax=Pleurodeles waltl TaxID=8319 RepID=A0AAV7URJ1_PLEWA|nr:hypothetical protein NDU88_000804 [Pleurodeles waltl]
MRFVPSCSDIFILDHKKKSAKHHHSSGEAQERQKHPRSEEVLTGSSHGLGLSEDQFQLLLTSLPDAFLRCKDSGGMLYSPSLPTSSISYFIVSSPSSSSSWPSPDYDEDVDSPVTEAMPRSTFLQKVDHLALFRYLGDNLGIPMEDDVPGPSFGLFQQFHSCPPTSLSVNKEVLDPILREWKDQEKAYLPRFLIRFYPLAKGDFEFPSSLKIDPLLSHLASRPSILSEEVPISNFVDRRVKASLKKSFLGLNLALRAAIYTVYPLQSLVKEFHSLTLALQECC